MWNWSASISNLSPACPPLFWIANFRLVRDRAVGTAMTKRPTGHFCDVKRRWGERVLLSTLRYRYGSECLISWSLCDRTLAAAFSRASIMIVLRFTFSGSESCNLEKQGLSYFIKKSCDCVASERCTYKEYLFMYRSMMLWKRLWINASDASSIAYLSIRWARVCSLYYLVAKETRTCMGGVNLKKANI